MKKFKRKNLFKKIRCNPIITNKPITDLLVQNPYTKDNLKKITYLSYYFFHLVMGRTLFGTLKYEVILVGALRGRRSTGRCKSELAVSPAFTATSGRGGHARGMRSEHGSTILIQRRRFTMLLMIQHDEFMERSPPPRHIFVSLFPRRRFPPESSTQNLPREASTKNTGNTFLRFTTLL